MYNLNIQFTKFLTPRNKVRKVLKFYFFHDCGFKLGATQAPKKSSNQLNCLPILHTF